MSARLQDAADWVIVGTGAGGATAARVLSAAGHSVVMLEEGPNLEMRSRPRALLPAMRDVFRDLGTTVANGPAPIPILQGRVVGGSTAINSGIIWRMPETIRQRWIERHGLQELVGGPGLERAFEIIEKELEIDVTGEEILGGNSLRLREGAQALGHAGHATRRNARRCRGSAGCLQGCPSGAKQSMDVSYVPRAVADGARLYPLARVDRVMRRGGRAVGVRGRVLDPRTRKPVGTLEVTARRGVILSAGVVHTPVLLRRSGIKGMAGERFQAHPGTALVARFPSPVNMGFGATQGFQVPFFDRGYKIESLSLPAEMLGSRLPGAGAEWEERTASLDHYTQWAVMCRMEAMGRVRPGFGGRASVRFVPTPLDMTRLREGLVLAARMAFAAGAIEVFPGMAGRPEVLRDVSEVKRIEEGPVGPRDFHMLATHLFGTACAGNDPTRSVVGPDLRVHGVEGLYVMDASVFPTTLGVNPQHTIMGVVWRAAERLAA